MRKLTLILFLRNDPDNSLSDRILYLIKQKKLQSLEGRDDVLLLSDNAILVDQTTAHGIYLQLCADLVGAAWPYLLVPIDAESTVAVGKFPQEAQNILALYGISMTT